ncbi:Zn-dependent peptidase ImmA (M78 family)/DNA-binding XRE family transcriptional regulator [Pseudomonas sp. W3I7]|jgi:Zn-dependent peptidase ImmA (M78 family)/DNA-binding XRE family transcriptional regulator|uniref:XRE family transcriptional regulator n=1 Tax=Pseudomonas sp. W3I7 TaxID=3042292 RepID=UPI00278D3321|nr:XRE family transcriptional regulator [Pseudomonas sp. W3I7]MDQ0706253.1 Zn-dependent peptidase ImmA (M78 family)/DNA-binding XRE family transcriptional regulator [Pseudomonas sp. W3I7]
MTQTAYINPAILFWSRQRAGLSEAQVAKGLMVKLERLKEWEGGQSLPSFHQAQKWAAIVHVPFGYLFLRAPPPEHLPLPDLRTLGGVLPDKPSLNLMDTVKDVLRKQDWYLEYLQDHERSPLPFVGSFTSRSAIKDVVADIRRVLGVTDAFARMGYEDYVRALVSGAEEAGILVMRSGVALGNTHRKLDVSEFRGFAISNPMAPVVFINSADAPTARLFTLMHELAHIWIGSTGVSDGSNQSARQEEAFCNAVAGEFLAPENVFRAHWGSDVHWEENLGPLAGRFRVSTLVIARRARDLGYISNDQYGTYYRRILQEYRDKEGSGGDYYRTAAIRNSTRLSKAVLAEAQSGRILLRDAGKLLGVQPAKLKTYGMKLSA